MNKREHTASPWIVEVSEEYPNGLIASPARETMIAEVLSNGQTGTEVMANARLIAAAPELLEACEAVLKDGRDIHVLKLRAAIAKTRGRA